MAPPRTAPAPSCEHLVHAYCTHMPASSSDGYPLWSSLNPTPACADPALMILHSLSRPHATNTWVVVAVLLHAHHTWPDHSTSGRYRYPTPYVSAGSDSPFWYSVNAGGAHIIMVSLWCRSRRALVLSMALCLWPATAQVRSGRCPNASCAHRVFALLRRHDTRRIIHSNAPGTLLLTARP